MKNYIIYITLALVAMVSFGACSDSDGGGGTPVIRYIRPCDVAAADSLLVRAYLGERIAIIGENLGGVREIYFNDEKASLNPNFVTDHTIIVTIPNTIPVEKKDIMELRTSSTSITYSFEALVPAPIIESMTCEYVSEGETAYIQGYYFVNDEGSPLEVIFPGGYRGEVVSCDENNIEVIVPQGATVSGPIEVSSIYGTTESGFYFRDNRNVILDFDTIYPSGAYNHGWHAGAGYGTENGLDGQYLIFTGTMKDYLWDDSRFGYERWTYTLNDPDFFDATNLNLSVLKFEVNIPDAWSSSALQIIFTGAEESWLNWEIGGSESNAYVSDETYPRALWMPWTTTDDGSYTTDGWITVTIPMSDFKYNANGETVAQKGVGHYSGITLFVNGGGVTGTECTPTFHIDNVRVVDAY